jgi:hypothetical protein
MASSISNHSQQSHLHASSMTVDLASSPMSFSTDVGSAVLGTCLQAKSLGFDASHCQGCSKWGEHFETDRVF